MKIALDVDGVLADFNTSFIALANAEGLGHHFPETADEITQWYYSEREHISNLFAKVIGNESFWAGIPGYTDTPKPLPFNPVAYITARPIGSSVTAAWLTKQGFPEAPVYTVKEGEDKLKVLRDLGSPIFVDDKMETVIYLNSFPDIVCWVFDRGWNQGLDKRYMRIHNLSELEGAIARDRESRSKAAGSWLD